jgi:polysaccharide biosynthesis protein PslF
LTTRYGFVSTYPPTRCGLATFTAALRQALVAPGSDEAIVVRLVDTAAARPGPEVVAQIVDNDNDPAALNRASEHLNACDIVIVQHSYDVYGGQDGTDIRPLLERLEVPSIVVLHSIPSAPTHHQQEALAAVAAKASALVVLSAAARDRLTTDYDVDAAKVRFIPHGAPDMRAPTHTAMFRSGQFTALTWGLFGPGKGIEWAIEAMSLLGEQSRSARYVVAGATRPDVLGRDGEAYRDGLNAQIRRLELQASVSLDGHYRDAASLAHLVRSADVVVLPYDSDEHVASGVLVEAVAAGKPVIATEFPHARELLGGGAGLLVPHRDASAIADALRTLMSGGDVAVRTARAASDLAPTFMWPVVAEQYRTLAAQLIDATVAA